MGLRTPLSASLAIHGVVLALAAVAPYVAPAAPRPLTVDFVQAAAALPTPARAVAAAPRSAPARAARQSVVAAAAASVPSAVVDAAAGAETPQSAANIANVVRPSMPLDAPVSPPRYDAAYFDNPAPAYPPAARRRRIEGTVLLDVVVGADGRPSAVAVAVSSGEEQLDCAALTAVRTWRFVPARRGTEPVAAQVRVPLRFRLDG
ncbi:MAG: energy transducer TonB [Rhodocyclaceae bacterium]|nr:energy transducer TonB [Rhodocyclaceae bacterium]